MRKKAHEHDEHDQYDQYEEHESPSKKQNRKASGIERKTKRGH